MKKLLLTSNIGSCTKIDGEKVPCIIDNSNKMVDFLKHALTIQKKLVILPSNPEDFERNDFFHKINESSFKMSGFSFNKVITIDNRNKNDIESLIQGANLIILGGGRVPIQNKWFKEINLKVLLKDYDGIIVGISAGSMNSSDLVYSCPEDEGEAINPNYDRWIEGLGLTDIKILPHYDELTTKEIDGLKVIEDIVLPDSYKYPIYGINDGSFIKIEKKEKIIYGECFKIHNGVITKICDNGNTGTIE